MVAAIKMVDDAKGSLLAPADWESNQPTITNTKAGVIKFYQEMYKEEKQKKNAEEQVGLLSLMILGGLYKSLFGASSPVDPVEAEAVQDTVLGIANGAIERKKKESEENSKYNYKAQ